MVRVDTLCDAEGLVKSLAAAVTYGKRPGGGKGGLESNETDLSGLRHVTLGTKALDSFVRV